MDTNSLAEKIVAKTDPYALYQKREWCEKEAHRLLTQVRDYRMQLQLASTFWTWNGCRQMYYMQGERFSNLLPKDVAEEVVASDLYYGNEPRMI